MNLVNLASTVVLGLKLDDLHQNRGRGMSLFSFPWISISLDFIGCTIFLDCLMAFVLKWQYLIVISLVLAGQVQQELPKNCCSVIWGAVEVNNAFLCIYYFHETIGGSCVGLFFPSRSDLFFLF